MEHGKIRGEGFVRRSGILGQLRDKTTRRGGRGGTFHVATTVNVLEEDFYVLPIADIVIFYPF